MAVTKDGSRAWSLFLAVLLLSAACGCLKSDPTGPGVEQVTSVPVGEAYTASSGPGTDTAQSAGPAQCLTDKGAVLYGASWCTYTKKQIESFGDSFRHIKYVECSTREAYCDGLGISGYPTWIINGTRYPGYRPLSVLYDIAGCS